LASEHAWSGRAARLEQVRDTDAERARDSPERRDACTRLAALDLAQEALADTCAIGDRLQRGAAGTANRAQSFAHVDLGARFRRTRGHPSLLRPRRRKTEATLRPG